MKSLSPLAVAAVLFMATQAMALPNQPAVEPAVEPADHGTYAVQSQLVGPTDPALAKAYDNFTLGADYIIDGFAWTGIYAEAFPADPSDTDFIVEIWGVDAGNNGYAAAEVAPLLIFNFEGGTVAGTGGPDLMVTALGHVSSATDSTPGGGEAFSYMGDVAPIQLNAGDYWISILANQLFDSADVDPEWQWHLGTGPGDGFTAHDRLFDPVDTLEAGLLQADKDLAFTIKGQLVPEPTTALMAMFGLCSLGLIRRKRS